MQRTLCLRSIAGKRHIKQRIILGEQIKIHILFTEDYPEWLYGRKLETSSSVNEQITQFAEADPLF